MSVSLCSGLLRSALPYHAMPCHASPALSLAPVSSISLPISHLPSVHLCLLLPSIVCHSSSNITVSITQSYLSHSTPPHCYCYCYCYIPHHHPHPPPALRRCYTNPSVDLAAWLTKQLGPSISPSLTRPDIVSQSPP